MQTTPLVGAAVSPFEGIGPANFIRGLRLLGVDFVEINRSAFAEIDRIADNLGPMLSAFHLPLVFEDGWDFSSLAHRAEIDDTIERLNAVATKLKIRHVVSHPPECAVSADPTHSSLDFLLTNLKRLNLPVYLENIPETAEDEFERMYRIAQKKLGPQLAGMCFDAPHYYISGHNPIVQFHRHRRRIGCIHLSDCVRDDDGHLPFHSGGTLPVESFLQTVADTGFSGLITLEVKPPSLNQLDSYIETFLTTLQFVDYGKYLKKRLRLFALKPLINRFQTYQLGKKVA